MERKRVERLRLFADIVAQMPALEDAWPAVSALQLDDLTTICLTAVDHVFDSLDRSLPVTTIVPRIPRESLHSSVVPGLLPSEIASSWGSLIPLTLDELLLMPSMGRRRVIRLLTAGVLAAMKSGPSYTVERAVRLVAARVALDQVEASVSEALQALSSNDPVIAAARRLLSEIPASVFLTDELRPLVDPVMAASSFRASVDHRHRLVLDERVASVDPPLTLQALADRLGVTRERVRQIQQAVQAQLGNWKSTEGAGPTRAAAEQLARLVGKIQRLDALPPEWASVRVDAVSPEVRLILHLAGPYRRDGSWLVHIDFVDWRDRVQRAVETVLGPDRTAPLEQCVAAVEALGISPTVAEQSIVDCGSFRHIGDLVVDWRGNLANRAEVVLASEQRPLSVDGIARRIGEQIRPRSVAAAVSSDERFERSGTAGWRLRRWDRRSYPGAFNALLAALDSDPERTLPLDDLVEDLAERYGMDPGGLRATAENTPLLIVDDGHVRRRRASEPYRSQRFLKDTRDLFSVDGAWSLRLVADDELLNGEPVTIPDSFATYLGMQPGTSGSLTGPVRAVPMSWAGHEPRIGSIRREAALLEAEREDLLFVRRVTLTQLEFRLVKRNEWDVREPAVRVARLVGAEATAASDPLKTVGSALGLGGAVAYEPWNLVYRLRARGDADVLQALLLVVGEEIGLARLTSALDT